METLPENTSKSICYVLSHPVADITRPYISRSRSGKINIETMGMIHKLQDCAIGDDDKALRLDQEVT